MFDQKRYLYVKKYFLVKQLLIGILVILASCVLSYMATVIVERGVPEYNTVQYISNQSYVVDLDYTQTVEVVRSTPPYIIKITVTTFVVWTLLLGLLIISYNTLSKRTFEGAMSPCNLDASSLANIYMSCTKKIDLPKLEDTENPLSEDERIQYEYQMEVQKLARKDNVYFAVLLLLSIYVICIVQILSYNSIIDRNFNHVREMPITQKFTTIGVIEEKYNMDTYYVLSV